MHMLDYFICYHLESGWYVTRPNQGLSLGRVKSLGTRLARTHAQNAVATKIAQNILALVHEKNVLASTRESAGKRESFHPCACSTSLNCVKALLVSALVFGSPVKINLVPRLFPLPSFGRGKSLGTRLVLVGVNQASCSICAFFNSVF